MTAVHGPYIDGAYATSDGEELSIRNPASGDEIARVSRATASDVDRAVTLATSVTEKVSGGARRSVIAVTCCGHR